MVSWVYALNPKKKKDTCFGVTCNNSYEQTVLYLWSLCFFSLSVSPRSNSPEDWNHHKRAVFFRDEEQRAWDRCDKPGIEMILQKIYLLCICAKLVHTTAFWVIDFFDMLQRLNEARRMMDKLRACIVANYYASAGITRLPEVTSHIYHNQ